MIGILMQISQESHTINGSDLVFGIKDVGIIVGGIISTLTAWLTLRFSFNAFREAANKEIAGLREDLIAERLTRHSMKKEVGVEAEKRDAITHKRIDAIRDDFRKAQDKTAQEFKEINGTISKVKQDTSEIKGMIQTLLNQKN